MQLILKLTHDVMKDDHNGNLLTLLHEIKDTLCP